MVDVKMNSVTEQSEEKSWVGNVHANHAGTIFFHRLIETFGIHVAYGVLFFAAWQYALFDAKSVRAIRAFRLNCGLSTRKSDFFHHFRSFGISLIDRFILTRGMRDAIRFRFKYCNEAVISVEADRGGVILLGAHMGNWEIAGALLSRRLSKPVHVFMYDDQNDATDSSKQETTGVIIHPVQAGGADIAVEIVNALRNGEIVCMHGDRFYEGQRTLEIGFLGKMALFPAGPMAMAAITGASVIPCFTMRRSLFEYEFSAATPIHPERGERGNRDTLIRSAMERYVAVLEEKCREFPLQWYNFFPFWRENQASD